MKTSMQTRMAFFALFALFLGAGCSSHPTQTMASESTPAATTASAESAAVPAPAPSTEGPQNETQACEGKAAKDPCSYGAGKSEVKGTCVRNESYTLQCLPKKSKKGK